MATTVYTGIGLGSTRLKPEMLSVGDMLNMLVRSSSKMPVLERVAVTRILKTRVVVEREDGTLLRFIVAEPNYRGGYLNGLVEGSLWGYELYTTDDETYKPRLAESQRHFLRKRAEAKAVNALEEFKRTRSLENANAAIAAINVWRKLELAEKSVESSVQVEVAS